MTSRTQIVDLDAWFGNTGGGSGNGNGNKMSVGLGTSSWAFINRFAIRIPRDGLFTGIPSSTAINAFAIKLRTNSGNTGIGGSVHFYLERGTTAFSEYKVVAGSGGVPGGANINAYVSSAAAANGQYPGPTRTSTDRAEYSGSPAADTWITVNALALGRWWYDHPATTSLILVGVAADETLTAQRCTFYTRESSSKPYAEITYGGNSPPNKPTSPSVTVGSTSFTLTTTYTDPDGDTSTKYEALFTPDPT